jgi:exonuclease VII large subunit
MQQESQQQMQQQMQQMQQESQQQMQQMQQESQQQMQQMQQMQQESQQQMQQMLLNMQQGLQVAIGQESARSFNMHAAQAANLLRPLPLPQAPNGAQGFPGTRGGLFALTGNAAGQLLNMYGQDDQGTAAAKRQRLAEFVGVLT